MANQIRTVLSGLGNINRSFLKILEMKEEHLERSLGLQFRIVGVADSSGSAASSNGFDPGELRAFKERGDRIADLPAGTTRSITDLVDGIEADLVLEASPVDLETGHPGLQVTRTALKRGCTLSLPTRLRWCSIMQESRHWPKTMGSDWPSAPLCVALCPSSTLGGGT